MRIVKNLAETIECPNCGCGMLYRPIKDPYDLAPKKICTRCSEDIYEGEDDIDNAVIIPSIEVGKAPDDIDDSLMEIEYAVSDLTRYATTQHELDQMERIRDIFDELISVIRRMK